MNVSFLTQRAQSVGALLSEPLDVLVIGGGIVGAGIVRDAAMRGLRVGLVEQFDFAFGTSSRSSRLLHGGLRYLAQGRLGLVHEASVEKKIVHNIAPHLAQPLPFVFPTYKNNHDWKLWQLKIGVKIYDLLCGGKNLGNSTWLSRSDALEHIPSLQGNDLNGAVRYYDALTNDARLVIDTLRSAANHGAILLNHAKFENAQFMDQRFSSSHWRCQVSDRLVSAKHQVLARAVVNATGPWAGNLPHSQVQLRLTKGIHLVVRREQVPVPDAVVMSEGKRILFAIPWGDRTILGTTDTDYKGSLENVTADVDDVHYVLKIANEFFPKANLTDADVISLWAGLRPLIASKNGGPSDISRSHQIRNPEPQWWDVAGGKLTTYRLMAEQTVDAICKELRLRHGKSRTAIEPLLEKKDTEFSGILPPEFSRRAVEHFCAKEWAMHLDDIMLRRAGWHYYHPDAAQKARQVAEWMGELLGWSASEKTKELQRYGTNSPAEQPTRALAAV